MLNDELGVQNSFFIHLDTWEERRCVRCMLVVWQGLPVGLMVGLWLFEGLLCGG